MIKLYNKGTKSVTNFMPQTEDGTIKVYFKIDDDLDDIDAIRVCTLFNTINRVVLYNKYKIENTIICSDDFKLNFENYNINNNIDNISDVNFDIVVNPFNYNLSDNNLQFDRVLQCGQITLNDNKNDVLIEKMQKNNDFCMVFKYFLLKNKYNENINFSMDDLLNVEKEFNEIKNLIKSNKHVESNLSYQDVCKLTKSITDFSEAINDDLNTPQALEVLIKMLNEMPKCEDVYLLALKFDEALGLEFDKI